MPQDRGCGCACPRGTCTQNSRSGAVTTATLATQVPDHNGGDARGLLAELWLRSVVPKRRRWQGRAGRDVGAVPVSGNMPRLVAGGDEGVFVAVAGARLAPRSVIWLPALGRLRGGGGSGRQPVRRSRVRPGER